MPWYPPAAATQLHHLQQDPFPAFKPVRRRGHDLKGLGEQAVPGQDGGGLVKLLVAGGPAPAQIVVVHGRQIVVDQGIGVDHLQGAGHGQGFARVAPHRVRRGQAQDGAQPFAPHEQAVVHGLPHPEGRPPHLPADTLPGPG